MLIAAIRARLGKPKIESRQHKDIRMAPLHGNWCACLPLEWNCVSVSETFALLWHPEHNPRSTPACFVCQPLQMVIVTVWITSAVYSTPKFVFSKTIKNIHTEDGQEEEICVLDREMFNSKLLDMINFVLLYVMPLLVMTVRIRMSNGEIIHSQSKQLAE